MGEHDEWRHVREVLAKRTPDSELLVHRHGGEIVAVIGEKVARVMLLRVPEGTPRVRADADLDALSTLWNVADALLAAADALAGERRRVAAARAVLDAPLWDADDETESTICRCDWCAAEVAELAATYRCRECGYRGRPMAWGCLDPENLARMGRERGESYSPGQATCPICGERELEADPWRALRAIRDALAADAPGQLAKERTGG